jgi:hypothetical protein
MLLVAHPAAGALSCDFSQDVQELEKASDTSAYTYTLQKELDLRKKILEGAIRCIKEEGVTAKEKIDPETFTHENAKKAAKAIKDKLAWTLDYPDTQLGRVKDLGIQGTKDLAREVKDWRTNTLLPLFAEERNVVLFEKAVTLYETADQRGTDLGAALRTLSLEDDDRVKIPYTEALKTLRDGKEQLDGAAGSLERMGNPDAVAGALKGTLDTLSRSYESFFKVREALKEILSL